MHLKRWITGLTALPFLFLLISKGGTQLFALVVSIVSTIALWEYFHLVSKTDENARPAFTEGSKVAKKKKFAFRISIFVFFDRLRHDLGSLYPFLQIDGGPDHMELSPVRIYFR